jgi:hypothetical protein
MEKINAAFKEMMIKANPELKDILIVILHTTNPLQC